MVRRKVKQGHIHTHMNVQGKKRWIGQVDPERKGNSKKSNDTSATATKQRKASKTRLQSGVEIKDGLIRNPAAKQTNEGGNSEFLTGKANLQQGVLGTGKKKRQQRGGGASEIASLIVH